MATITSEMVTEYFSTMGLRRNLPDILYLDEFAIYPKYLSDKDSRHLLGAIFSNTIEPISTHIKIDWSYWNSHFHRDWDAFLKSNIEMAGL